MGIISGIFGFSCSNFDKIENKAKPTVHEGEGYKLYVQYENTKELKDDSEVKMNGRKVGNVISFEQNPDASIVTLLINEGVEIPLLSNFKIVSTSDHIYFINIERSTETRLISPNEYFSGEK